jgi:pimeloyl-ACP methyl ester carboxylesterase
MKMAQEIVLIHGAWLTPRSWENYVTFFEAQGYEVSAPEWPRKTGEVEEQREDTEELKGLGVTEIVDHYDEIIRAKSEPPVIIGHSFGGLFTQLLLDRGLGRAGVALDPAPPKGILRIYPSSLKAAGPALNHPSKHHGVVTLTEKQVHYGFTNTWPEDAAHAAYERYAVPETGQIFYEDGFANFHLHPPTQLDWEREGRAPLLLVAGDHDHTVPAGTVESNFKKYKKSASRTDFLEFKGRSHFHMAEEGWEEIAGAVNDWLTDVLSER